MTHRLKVYPPVLLSRQQALFSIAARHEHGDVCTPRILNLLVCVMYLTQDQEFQHRPTSFQTLVVKMYNAAFTLFIKVSTYSMLSLCP
jgi:hypothetical protein